METEALTRLLSGTSMLAPRLGRAGLSILTTARLAALAMGTKSLWRDELGDLFCNSTTSCRLTCFDSAFPVSPFSLFLLQSAFTSAHGLACCFLWRLPNSQGKSAWQKGWLLNRTRQLQLHALGVLARIFLEGIFLAVFHSLYGRYPQGLRCPASTSCPNTVQCTIQKAQGKDAFNLFVAGISWGSIMVCLMVLYPAITEIFQLTLHPAKRQLGRPLLIECA
ncbi:gap junction beta-2 protein-like [Eublepharis macularius]|uniref:Gap junction beta-2 protein-like n=1 Tax=Eublepharis macularius TaxID=481883 RepID=A0AA97L0C3_EUBMA|nr:gap junction beta-2 protein-like [Eublepharis macularius]